GHQLELHVGTRAARGGAARGQKCVVQRAHQVRELVPVDAPRLGEYARAQLLHEVLGVLAGAAQRPGGAVQRVEVADEGLGIEAGHLWGIRKKAGKDRNPRGVLEDMKLVILPILAVLAAGSIAACGGSDNRSGTSSSTSHTSSAGGAYGAAPKATATAAASGAVSIKTATGKPGTFLVDS